MASGSGIEGLADESSNADTIIRRRGTRDDVRASTNISEEYEFPIPTFAQARLDKKNRLMPQIISHRGCKAKFPENSLLAFGEAVRAGAAALETDIHLTRDDVVVLSHDEDLKKFGVPKQIIDCTWNEIEQMKTLAQPHVPMLRLKDLLEYLLQPSQSEVWLLLDIKSDNQADDVMRLLASTIASATPLPTARSWNQRILLGLWAGRYLPLAAQFLPGFSVVHVGFHLSHARRNLGLPNVGSTMLVQTLLAPGGRSFLRDCQAGPGSRINIAWTVNDRDKARWCARRGLDGMITDDPASLVKFLDLYDEHTQEAFIPVSIWGCLDIFIIFSLVNGLFWYFRRTMKLDDDVGVPNLARR